MPVWAVASALVSLATLISGLGAAVATGLIIGVFPPEQLASYAATLTGAEVSLSDYVPGDMTLGTVATDG